MFPGADGMCRQQLKAFMAANPGAAAGGMEWGFRHLGRHLMQQPGPAPFNVTGDDPAEHVSTGDPKPNNPEAWQGSVSWVGVYHTAHLLELAHDVPAWRGCI